jgi:hypothetical protein
VANRGIRDLIRDISPPWLRGGQAERFLYGFGLLADGVLDKLTDAISNHRPDKCDESALPIIANDRLIQQGVSEPDVAFRARLQTAFEAWQLAGSPWRTLREPLRSLLTKQPRIRLIANRYTPGTSSLTDTKWDTYEEAADTEQPPTHLTLSPGDWAWDGLSPVHGSYSWARIWVMIESVGGQSWCTEGTQTFGDGSTWGDPAVVDRSWGFDTRPQVFGDLITQIKLWKAQHATLVNLIVSFDASHFHPDGVSGFGIKPDGHFGRFGKFSSNAYVQSRTVISHARWCASVE